MNSTSPEPPNVPGETPPGGTNPPSAFSEVTQKAVDTTRQAAQSMQQTARDLTEAAKVKSAQFVERSSAQINRDPTKAVLEALIIGFAIGLLVRLLESSKGSKVRRDTREIDVEHKPTVEDAKFHLGSLFLPFVWPFYQGTRQQYQRSAEKVQNAYSKVKETDLRKLGRKSAKKVEEWVEDEVTPAVECGWKKIRKLWS